MKRIYLIFVLLLLPLFYFANKFKISNKFTEIKKTDNVVGTFGTRVESNKFEVVAENLNVPWEIVILPNDDILVTERGGKLLRIGKDIETVSEIAGVSHIGEGGLLGMALDPKFEENNYIYLYSTTGVKGSLSNRVERYKLVDNSLTDQKVILAGIKGSPNHDGGRISFGPDGLLYITTGDAENPKLAQDRESLNGKILRIRNDGSIPSDNPFGNEVYSFGHRNPQGLAWDKNGNLWASEHGPSGIQTGNDEINLIVKGGNYGWPEIKGQEAKNGMISPVAESGKSDTWAPSGMVILADKLFFAGLRGEALYESSISTDNSLSVSSNFKNQFGRLRTVVIGRDKNSLYIVTNNTDGRGKANSGDDRIIKVYLNKL